MYKIVMLGVENSHADHFLKFIKESYSDIEVSGIYSEEKDATKKLSEQFGVKIMTDFADAAGSVDGVIVTARHGDNHLKYAEPYVKSGVPMFIDKPITQKESDVKKLMELFEKYDVKFTGGSSCRHCDFVQNLKRVHQNEIGGKTIGGLLRCPVNLKNDYGDFYFYGQHLAECVIEIFGEEIKSVITKKNRTGLNVLFRYSDFDITGVYVDGNYNYYALRLAEEGNLGGNFSVGEKEFRKEFSEFYNLLAKTSEGEKKSRFSVPVFVLNAIMRSLNSGNEEKIKG